MAFTVRAGEVDAAEAGPAVTGAAVTSSPAGGGAYAPGEEIAVTVRFDAPVTVDTAGGTPTIGLRVGGKTRRAGYGGGSGTAALAFAYTVTADDDGAAAGIRVIGNSLSLNGGTIQGGAGADADTAFDVAPAVTGVAVAPDADGTWAAGEEIAVTVTFSETVTVDTANGRPSIGLALGGRGAGGRLRGRLGHAGSRIRLYGGGGGRRHRRRPGSPPTACRATAGRSGAARASTLSWRTARRRVAPRRRRTMPARRCRSRMRERGRAWTRRSGSR